MTWHFATGPRFVKFLTSSGQGNPDEYRSIQTGEDRTSYEASCCVESWFSRATWQDKILLEMPTSETFLVICQHAHDTIDGRNPAPVDMVDIPLFTRVFAPSQVVSRISSINSTVKPYNKKLCHCCQTLAAFLMGTGAVRNFFRAETLGAHF